MIISYKDKMTEAVAAGGSPKGFPSDLVSITRRKLAMINAAVDLVDLRVPPANRLEALTGDRAGQHSIRVNDQYRLCFRWVNGNAEEVEFTDYH